MKPCILILVMMMAHPAVADTAPELLWHSFWNGSGDFSDEALAVAVDVDGSVVVLGRTHNPADGGRLLMQRYHTNGELQWSRIWPEEYDNVEDIRLEPDGSAIIPCQGWQDGAGSFWSLLRVDSLGDIVWEQRFLSDLGSFPQLDRDSEGNWCVASLHDSSDFIVVKIDPEGTLLWSRTLDLGDTEAPSDIAVGPGDRLFVGGNSGMDFNVGACFSSQGDSLWTALVTPNVLSRKSFVCPLPDGGAVFASTDESLPWGALSSMTWRVDAGGNLLWQGQYPPPGDLGGVEPIGVLVTENQRSITVGSGGTGNSFHAQCFDAQGIELWEGNVSGSTNHGEIVAAHPTPGGAIVAAGHEFVSPSDLGFRLSAFTSEGMVLWSTAWNPAPGFQDRVTDMAMGPDGSIVVVGYGWAGTGNGGEQLIIGKFAAPLSAVEPAPEPVAARVQAYPNPFNPMTRIRYTVAEDGPIRLAVYDAAGRLVRTLVQRDHIAGQHELTWYGRDDAGRAQASGTYLLRLETSAGVSASRLTLVR